MKIFVRILLLFVSLSICSQEDFKKTEILILGTPHLFQIEGFQPHMLDSVKAKLNTFDFDVIGVEKMPGQLLYDIAARNDSAFSGLTRMKKHIKIADSVQAELGIGFLEAEQAIATLVEKEKLDIKDRKRLFYLFMATTNIPSAALQYRYLDVYENVFTTDFDHYLQTFIERQLSSSNEYFSLAVPLAQSKNLHTIEHIDDYQDVFLLMKYYPSFTEDFKKYIDSLPNISAIPVYKKVKQLEQQGVENENLSELYSFLNSDAYMEQDDAGQWLPWLSSNFPSNSDRARYTLWEMRNLKICAQLMKVVARHPRQRILVIIGSSHKGYLEKYLRQIPDIEILSYE